MASNNASSKNPNPKQLTSAVRPTFQMRKPDSSLCIACRRHLVFHRIKSKDLPASGSSKLLDAGKLPYVGKVDHCLCLAATAKIASIASFPLKLPKQPTRVTVRPPRQQLLAIARPSPIQERPMIGEENLPLKKRKVDLKAWAAGNNPSEE